MIPQFPWSGRKWTLPGFKERIYKRQCGSSIMILSNDGLLPWRLWNIVDGIPPSILCLFPRCPTLIFRGLKADQYYRKLGLWAHYCFLSRNFWSIALQADVSKFRTEFQRLVTNGVNLDDTVKVLLPLLETQNHSQDTTTEYELNEGGFTVSKNVEMKPGDTVNIPYDLETHRFNNTLCTSAPVITKAFATIEHSMLTG